MIDPVPNIPTVLTETLKDKLKEKLFGLSVMKRDVLVAVSRGVLNELAPQGRGVGHLDLWDHLVKVSDLLPKVRAGLVGGVGVMEEVALSYLLSWNPGMNLKRRFNSGPQNFAKDTLVSWTSFLRLAMNVVCLFYGIDSEKRPVSMSEPPAAKRWAKMSVFYIFMTFV